MTALLVLATEAGAQAPMPGLDATWNGPTFSGGEVINFGEGMTRPQRLAGPDPVYTVEALKARVQGLLIVKCIIATDGLLYNCRIIKPLPFMGQAILDALAARRYSPVTFQGRPVNCDYVFNIKLVMPDPAAAPQWKPWLESEPASTPGRAPVPPLTDAEYTKDLERICRVHEITGKPAELGLQAVSQWLIDNIRTKAARVRLAQLPQSDIPAWLRDLRRDAAERGISPCPFSDTWEDYAKRHSK